MTTSQMLLQQQCNAVDFELQIENVILKQKNSYLDHLVDEYRDKYQQLSAQRKYIPIQNENQEIGIQTTNDDIYTQEINTLQTTLIQKEDDIRSLNREISHLNIKNIQLMDKIKLLNGMKCTNYL